MRARTSPPSVRSRCGLAVGAGLQLGDLPAGEELGAEAQRLVAGAEADRLAVPATVLWPEHDPLFPPAWSDRLDEFFAAATLQMMPGVGHFSPLEAPETFATAIRAAAGA